VHVSVRPHEHFLRDDNDLVTVLDVPAPLAALGCKLEVPTLDGPEDVHVRPGTQPGETIELRGRGMPVLRRPGRRGDLRVVMNVVIPRKLTEKQRGLLEQLAESMTDANLKSDESVFAKLKRTLRV
jgi:molecular chaperone DnaJ